MKIATYISMIVIPACLLLSWALRSPVIVVTEAIDAKGHIIFEEQGDPVLIRSAWLTWKANLYPNVLLILAVCLLIYVVYYVWVGLRPKYSPGGGRHEAARRQMPNKS